MREPADDATMARETRAASRATERRAGLRVDGKRLLVPVRVSPRAARNALTVADGLVLARLTAPPVEGAANEALIALLASRLRLPKRAIEIVHGGAARTKTIAVEGLSTDEFLRRIAG